MTTLQKLQTEVAANIEKAKYQLEMNEGCMVSHNTVVVFPETLLTCRLHSGNEVVVNPAIIAAQFTPEGAKEVIAITKNGRGESPIAMGVCQYYRAQIKQMTEFLESITQD